MARARNIKPGLFKNELLVEQSLFVRLLFVGLWTLADREGRLEDRPKRIKLELFPYDSEDTDAALEILSESGFIKRYEADGKRVIQIVNFLKHQTPHGTEKDSDLPAEDGSYTVNERNSNGYVTGNKRVNNVISAKNNVRFQDSNEAKLGVKHPDSLNPDSLNPDSNISTTTVVEVRSDAAGPAEPEAENKKLPSCPHQKVIDLYHESLPYCPQVREWNTTRQKYLQSRWREKAVSLGWQKDAEGLEWFKRFFSFVGESKFLTGKADGRNGKPPFLADLEWLMRPSNFAKVVEGKYHQ